MPKIVLYQFVSGLESFSQEQAVLKRFESMATGKILLAEILERKEVPLVVLYDTSQDDDININAACMKALQDRSLESPLKVTKMEVFDITMKPSDPKNTEMVP